MQISCTANIMRMILQLATHIPASPLQKSPPSHHPTPPSLPDSFTLSHSPPSSPVPLQWVLSASYFNFPFPVTLTTTHMIFSSLLCALLVHGFKVVKLQPGMTTEL